MSGAVVVTDDGAVRTIRLNRPEKKNALTLAMYADMTAALREANQTDAIRCVMFAGSPGAFCAGNDISDFSAQRSAAGLSRGRSTSCTNWDEIKSRSLPRSAALPSASARPCCFIAITSLPQPMPYFSTPFLKLGLAPELASTLLAPMRMGHARAFSLLVMGRPLSAAEAKDAGIVNTVATQPRSTRRHSRRRRRSRRCRPVRSPHLAG